MVSNARTQVPDPQQIGSSTTAISQTFPISARNSSTRSTDSTAGLLYLWMMTQENQSLDGSGTAGMNGQQLLNAVQSFVNSVPELRDIKITIGNQETTIGEYVGNFSSANNGGHDRANVESYLNQARVPLGNNNSSNSVQYGGSPLLHSSLSRFRETSDYGARNTGIAGASSFHKGIDLATPIGTDLRAGTDAEVAFVGRGVSGYGNVVILNHGSGVLTLYGHLSDIDVRRGQNVRAGQQFAETGNTGIGSGAHLHFETIVFNERNGKWTTVDPELVLSGRANLSTAAGRASAIDMTERLHGRGENGLVSRVAEQTVADFDRRHGMHNALA